MVWIHPGEVRRTGSARSEFLPTDDPEARLYRADIIDYLVDYANRTLNPVSFDFVEVDFCLASAGIRRGP